MAHLQGMDAADKRGRVLRLAQQEGELLRPCFFRVLSTRSNYTELVRHPPRRPVLSGARYSLPRRQTRDQGRRNSWDFFHSWRGSSDAFVAQVCSG